jgi:hypothetical protein
MVGGHMKRSAKYVVMYIQKLELNIIVKGVMIQDMFWMMKVKKAFVLVDSL